jgi:hypothetical protein
MTRKTCRMGLAGAVLFFQMATAGVSLAQEWGDLEGKFVYDGKAPERKKLDTAKDMKCCGAFNVLDETLIVDKDGGVANVVIYLKAKVTAKQIHPDLEKGLAEKVLLDNKECRFTPHVSTVWQGKQTLLIHNSDECSHNSNLQPLLDKGVNPLLPPQKEELYKFGKEQNIPQPVSCNLHPWMKGYVLPRSNPYAAVSAADGTFKIEKLPAGEWEFQVWHENPGYLATPEWKQGRFKLKIVAGANKLGKDGVVKLTPEQLKSKS